MSYPSFRALLVTLLAVAPAALGAQQVHFPAEAAGDPALLDAEVPRLARELLRVAPDETATDAGEPLRLRLMPGSMVEVPVRPGGP